MGCSADRRAVLLVIAFVASACTAAAALFTALTAASPSTQHGHCVLPSVRPDGIHARTVAAIAARWGVNAGELHVEWTEPLPPSADGAVELRGSGIRGQWLVDASDADGRVHRGRLRAGVALRMAVAARDLPRGATIGVADIAWQDTIVWGPPPREPQVPAEGWQTRRVVTAGERLAPPAVAPPTWVRAGDDVRVIVTRGSLELAMSGRAAGTGAAGERVAVRAQTGRRLTGTITAPGVVRVDAGKDY